MKEREVEKEEEEKDKRNERGKTKMEEVVKARGSRTIQVQSAVHRNTQPALRELGLLCVSPLITQVHTLVLLCLLLKM